MLTAQDEMKNERCTDCTVPGMFLPAVERGLRFQRQLRESEQRMREKKLKNPPSKKKVWWYQYKDELPPLPEPTFAFSTKQWKEFVRKKVSLLYNNEKQTFWIGHRR